MNARHLVTASLVSLSMLASWGASAHEPGPGAEKITVLEKQPILNAPGLKAMVLTVEYAPGHAAMAHTHSGSTFAYVLEGEVISQINDGKAITYKQGETWYEPAGSKHYVSKNASSSKPAKILVYMLLGEQDKVLEPLGK